MTNSAVLERIRRLLSLAEGKGATPNEAAVAAAKAQELMLRHKLTREDLGDGDDIGLGDSPLFKARSIPDWVMALANCIARLNGCIMLLKTDRDSRGRVSGKRITPIGKKEDIEVVRYLFTYLHREVKRLAKGHGHAFTFGAVSAVIQSLEEAKHRAQESASSSTALVRIEDHTTAEAWARKNLTLDEGYKPKPADIKPIEFFDYVRGMNAGSRILVKPAVGGKKTGRKKRLG